MKGTYESSNFSPGNIPADIEGSLAFAKKAIKDGFFDIAEKKLSEMLKMNLPFESLAEVHLILGRIDLEKGEFQDASQEFNLILEQFSASPFADAAMYWLAETYYREKNYKEAIPAYQKVIDDYPVSKYAPFSLYSEAWCYEALGEVDTAVEILSDVSKNYPNTVPEAKALYKTGEILYKTGKFNKAASVLISFTEKYPVNENVFEAYYLLGDCYFKIGEKQKAIFVFEKLIQGEKIGYLKDKILVKLADAYASRSDFASSLKYFNDASSCATDPSTKCAALMGAASVCIKRNDVSGAMLLYKKIIDDIQSNPCAEYAYNLLGELYCRNGKYDEAIKTLTVGIKIFPDGKYSGRMHYFLGQCYLSMAKDDLAITEFEKTAAVSREPVFVASSLCDIGVAFERQGKLLAASDVFDRVLREFPDSGLADYAQYRVGDILKKLKKYDMAILAFRSLQVNFPKSDLSDKAAYQLGTLYAETDDYAESVNQFDKILGAEPRSVLYYNALLLKGKALYNSGDFNGSIKIFNSIITESSSDEIRISSRYYLGWAYYKIGNNGSALAIFNDILKSCSDVSILPGIKPWFGEYYYNQGDFVRAREYFEDIVKNYPESVFVADACYLLAWINYDIAKDEASAGKFLEIIERYPDSEWAPQAILTIGDIFTKSGKIDEAVKQYKGLLRKYPSSKFASTANNRIGIMLKDQNKYELSIEYFKLSLNEQNTEVNSQIQFDIADSYEKLGDTDRAIEEYLNVEYKYPRGKPWLMQAEERCALLLEKKGQFDKALNLYRKLSEGEGNEAEFAKEKIRLLKGRA
ncbi:MAG: tetratricopeptide repeat protein [Candidatus Omnitrophica bacterium]|nr:tetratricopeptide repeat protein [Candidatus Omnitrophota bacterium]